MARQIERTYIGRFILGILAGATLWSAGCASKPPEVEIVGVSVSVAGGTPVDVQDGGTLTVRAGDELGIVDLRYASALTRPEQTVAIEAYVRKGGMQPEDIDYDDGRFTRGFSVFAGTHHTGPVNLGGGDKAADAWTVETGWNQIMLVAVHYYGESSRHPKGYEVDATFSFDLQVQ